ncbi:MAG: elongation factor G [Planctomycetota bacterium]|nr:elongation factor G [Planctomycetota bacterium]
MDAGSEIELSDIRNIGIVAHIDAGKTTTTERILYYTGREHRLGSVDEGTTVTDYLEEEKRRGITITAAATSCFWRDKVINIIDTPGHVDFTAEVERSLRVLDGAVVVFDSVEGVEAQSETVWRQADTYKVPRIAFANKLDRMGALFSRVTDSMVDKLGAEPIAIQFPLGSEADFYGLVDLVENRALVFPEEHLGSRVEQIDIPGEVSEEVRFAREEMIEKIAELDEKILEKFIEGIEPTAEELRAALRRITLSSAAVPVLCGSSLKNKGVQPLLDAIVDLLPSPVEMPPVDGVHPKTEKAIRRNADPDEPFSALVFKIISKPTGDLTFMRVYSGKASRGDKVYNPRLGKFERLAHIYRMHADRPETVEQVRAGDIIAMTGLKATGTGDTLCDGHARILLEELAFPETLISMAVEPETNAERDKLELALATVSREDPTFKYKYDDETGQLIVSGMGELHLEIIVSKLRSEFKVKMRVGEPRVSYRETVTTGAESRGEFEKLVAGRQQFGAVKLRIEPSEDHLVPVFENEIREPNLTREYLEAIRDGVMSAVQSGALAAYPSINLKVVLTGFEYREEESSPPAYVAAASVAYRRAFSEGSPVLLEPLMSLEVTTPEEYLGNIVNDLNKRRATITDMQEKAAGIRVVKGRVPLSEMFGYATIVRSMSQGRATYTLEPSTYQPVPEEMTKKLLLV